LHFRLNVLLPAHRSEAETDKAKDTLTLPGALV